MCEMILSMHDGDVAAMVEKGRVQQSEDFTLLQGLASPLNR